MSVPTHIPPALTSCRQLPDSPWKAKGRFPYQTLLSIPMALTCTWRPRLTDHRCGLCQGCPEGLGAKASRSPAGAGKRDSGHPHPYGHIPPGTLGGREEFNHSLKTAVYVSIHLRAC